MVYIPAVYIPAVDIYGIYTSGIYTSGRYILYVNYFIYRSKFLLLLTTTLLPPKGLTVTIFPIFTTFPFQSFTFDIPSFKILTLSPTFRFSVTFIFDTEVHSSSTRLSSSSLSFFMLFLIAFSRTNLRFTSVSSSPVIICDDKRYPASYCEYVL